MANIDIITQTMMKLSIEMSVKISKIKVGKLIALINLK